MNGIVVLKFGGTSVATADLRRMAIERLREERERGNATVAVVSAQGRSPNPYATDSLLALVETAARSRNVDLLIACGETIAAAVFAEQLRACGMPAEALTGAQAGVITDRKHGNAGILRVQPAAVLRCLDAGAIPVVAGFQGVTEDGEITTLGRGGTDLTAIALAHALDAQRVDIYTDVSGAMTGDPRRIAGAHTIERATLEEMTELAHHGAKVMHDKAAELAHRTKTPYAIKGSCRG